MLGRDIEKRIRISGRQQFFPMPVCEMGEELFMLMAVFIVVTAVLALMCRILWRGPNRRNDR